MWVLTFLVVKVYVYYSENSIIQCSLVLSSSVRLFDYCGKSIICLSDYRSTYRCVGLESLCCIMQFSSIVLSVKCLLYTLKNRHSHMRKYDLS